MKDLFDNKAIMPMLLYEGDPFDDKDYIFELKFDGIRCLAYLEDNFVVLRNKRDKDVTNIYPELNNIYKCVNEKCILDGELVIFKDGKPDFYALQRRSLMSDEFKIKIASSKNAVEFVAYDILYLKNKAVVGLPLMERKRILCDNVKEGNGLSVSRYIEEKGKEFFNLAKQNGLEGIIAKKKEGKYHIGKRTREWIKIKVMKEDDLVICGYQPDDNGYPKDIVLGEMDGGSLTYRGKVYLGISDEERELLYKFSINNRTSAHFEMKGDIVWIKPKYTGIVKYMHATANGGMRQPIWKGIKE